MMILGITPRPFLMGRVGIAALVLFAVAAFAQDARAGDRPGEASFVVAQFGERPGQVSSGHCRCKDQCEVHRSVFSEGRSVAQCKAKCRAAFSGCTRGEIRSPDRRD